MTTGVYSTNDNFQAHVHVGQLMHSAWFSSDPRTRTSGPPLPWERYLEAPKKISANDDPLRYCRKSLLLFVDATPPSHAWNMQTQVQEQEEACTGALQSIGWQAGRPVTEHYIVPNYSQVQLLHCKSTVTYSQDRHKWSTNKVPPCLNTRHL